MKSLEDILLERLSSILSIDERLNLNNDSKIKDNSNLDEFTTVLGASYEFKNYNWVIPGDSWNSGRITFMADYAKKLLKENKFKFDDKQQLFIARFINDMRSLKYASVGEITEKINGPKPYFKRIRFIYDICNWALKTQNPTIPRENKLKKILREIKQSQAGDHIDEMSWA